MAQSLWFSSSCDASSQNRTHSWRVVFLDFGKGFLENNISHNNILIFPWFYLSCIPSIEHLESSGHSTCATRRWMMHVYCLLFV